MAFNRILGRLQDSKNVINLLFILTLYVSFNGQVDASSRSIALRRAQARQLDDDKDYIRQVPLCVDDSNLNPIEEGLHNWVPIFHFYRHNTYIPVSNGKTSPTGMITRMDLNAISVDDTDSGYNGVLKNWVHFEIESSVPLEGLYVQSIGAPWGIPFGEFTTDFDCGDCGLKTSSLLNATDLIPCLHRSALSYEHPNVFTIGGHEETLFRPKLFFKNSHFNFRYTQYPGVDFTYAQFLVIAVRNFAANYSRFETFYTQIYKLDVQDNVGGAFYPFYYGWRTEEIKCHSTALNNDWTEFPGADALVKIRYNRAFDYCVRKKLSLEWLTCPPGPIQMAAADVPLTLQEWLDLREKYSMKSQSNNAQYNTSFGPDGQFCNDSGTWEWTDGAANWTIPVELVVIYENGSLMLNESTEADKKGEHTISVICVSSNDQACQQFLSGLSFLPCNLNPDYHKSLCHIEQRLPDPFFGKLNNGTGDYGIDESRWNELTFTEQVQVQAINWGKKQIFGVHAKLMIFAWTVGWNVVCFSARFLKEYSVIEKKSSYFGIGAWLWHHIIWTYITVAAMLSGLYLIGNQNAAEWMNKSSNLYDLCNLHRHRNETDRCLNSTAHRFLGGIAAVLFMLGYVSGWGRPNAPMLRLLAVVYHCGMAYFGKIFYYIVMLLAYFQESIGLKTYMTVIIIDFASFMLFIVATAGNCLLDRKFPQSDPDPTQVVLKRQYFPVPEAISTVEMSTKLRKILHFTVLPIYIVVQVLCFILIVSSF